MKKSFLFLLLIIPLFLLVSSDIKGDTDWVLIWSDEFNYSGLPSAQFWSFETEGNSYGWGNGEDQFYTDSLLENARVGNGVLTITALEKQTGGKDYTSARIRTKGKFSTAYGRFEARMKLPGGRGTWPAFWLMPEEPKFGPWPKSGEIDIVEAFGWQPNKVSSATHTETYNHMNGNGRGGTVVSNNIYDQFHLYAVEWFPDRLDFFYDDKKIATVKGANNSPSKWPFSEPFYIILNLAIGGNWCRENGGIGDTPFPQYMVVDYVRVYKAKSDKPLTLGIGSSGDGSVQVFPQKEKYSFGEEVTVQAMPGEGKEFFRFFPLPTGSKITGNTLTFRIYQDTETKALFKERGEKIANGNFDLGFSGWTSWFKDPQSARQYFDNNSLVVDVKKLTEQPWEIQADYSGVTLEQGGVYQLKLDAKASKRRSLNFGIVQNYDPYNSYTSKSVDLSKDWKTYSVTFSHSGKTDDRCRLELDFGGATGKVWVDNVSLIRIR